MRMLLIAVVLIYGMELDNALYWYVAAGIAATWDGCFWMYTTFTEADE